MDNLLTLIEKGTRIRQSAPGRALEIFKKALNKSEMISHEEYRAKSLFNIAITYLILCDYNKSIAYFQDALETDFAQNETELQAEILRGLAENHSRNYNFKEALKFFYLSENASIQSWNMQNLHMVYQGIASLYTKLKLNEKALTYTMKSLDIAVQSGASEPLQSSLMSIGACYYKLGNFAEARKYFVESLELSCNPFAEANALHFVSHIKFDEGNYEEAEKLSLRQIEICSKNNYHDFEALGLRQMGKIMFKSGKYNEALEYFQNTLKVVNSKGDRTIKFATMKDIIDTYEKTGDKDKIIELYPDLYKEHVFHLESEMQLKIEQFEIENEAEAIRKEVQKEKENNLKLKKALWDVHALNDELNIIHEEKNNLLSILAHDLKNPLQSILSSLRLMQSEKSDNEFRNEMAKNIKHQSARMLNLINRLLDYKAIESGSISLNITSFVSSELSAKLIKNANILAVKKDIEIITECRCSEKSIRTDMDLFYQVLENLLSNSIKFSSPGSRIYLRCFNNGNITVFEIEDEGPGFTDDDKEKLYTDFARLSAQPTGNEHSTGLGLSIVKKLCDLLGAEIELHSHLNKGSKFTIKLINE
ncbi:MAG: tetratricopeptide repeat-containing sensor histidine kinase [Ignavibacteria bacterium]|nr:tetratricopeptide repeat-containing sensor histidine kinase [Ignavibacteria bacterium]